MPEIQEHRYRIDRVPVDLAEKVKISAKRMLGLTVSDYLRLRVLEESRIKPPGHEYSEAACNRTAGIDFRNIPWIKNPDVARVHTYIDYPEDAWIAFTRNCRIQKTTPRTTLLAYMIELCEQFIKFNKIQKRQQENSLKN
jgi:hypothetical protein